MLITQKNSQEQDSATNSGVVSYYFSSGWRSKDYSFLFSYNCITFLFIAFLFFVYFVESLLHLNLDAMWIRSNYLFDSKENLSTYRVIKMKEYSHHFYTSNTSSTPPTVKTRQCCIAEVRTYILSKLYIVSVVAGENQLVKRFTL